jgi:DNA helicase-2/ATP-dependent DNA helicase PcrA
MIRWDKCIPIESDAKIEDIERHFRVFAGPGAGKTFWLVQHIKNVLRRSRRLGRTRKIACITYTNNGVEEIYKQLRQCGDRVEVSTIHSFLYKNVVRPYGFLLKDTNGRCLVNLKLLDGHSEHIPNAKIIYNWKCAESLHYLKDNQKVYECLASLDWCFEEDGNLALRPREIWRLKVGNYFIKKAALSSYKKFYWEKGEVHHEDVLYFSYCLVQRFPRILEFLNTKFPYVFVDEFQDTNPIQTLIIRQIAKCETVIGVIGDPAQSIYSFQGAKREDFINFVLPNSVDYKIEGNRRSTANIIKFLNYMRGQDLKQTPIRNEEGSRIRLLVGDVQREITRVTKDMGSTPTILARRNDFVGRIKCQSPNTLEDLWVAFRNIDSNGQRIGLIYALVSGTALAMQGDFKEAIRGIEKVLWKYNNEKVISKFEKRRIAANVIHLTIRNWMEFCQMTILQFNNRTVEYFDQHHNVKIGATITRGNVKDFGAKWKIVDLVQSLKMRDDRSQVRTIHKAKGGEFDTVLLAFEAEADLTHVLDPKMDDAEDECRIYYVALSRARNQLILSVPSLGDDNRKRLQALGVVIEVGKGTSVSY